MLHERPRVGELARVARYRPDVARQHPAGSVALKTPKSAAGLARLLVGKSRQRESPHDGLSRGLHLSQGRRQHASAHIGGIGRMGHHRREGGQALFGSKEWPQLSQSPTHLGGIGSAQRLHHKRQPVGLEMLRVQLDIG